MRSLAILTAALLLGAGMLFAGSEEKPSPSSSVGPAVSTADSNQRWMIEGEKRYRANCGRCHQAPHKFPARAMATAIRHMRVRAMLTEDDAKYITFYMTH